jgi:hypothetical protein
MYRSENNLSRKDDMPAFFTISSNNGAKIEFFGECVGL